MTARKVMLLGEIGVGKSSIVERLVFDRFDLEYKPTIGVDVYRYEIAASEARPGVSLIIWDTDGNFGDTIFRHVYMKEASAALVVGDLSRRETLETMTRLGHGFEEALPGRHISFILNKIDLVGALGGEEFEYTLGRSGRDIVKTSAKTGENVQYAFLHTADAIIRRGH
jgi:small GTP-binding protein